MSSSHYTPYKYTASSISVYPCISPQNINTYSRSHSLLIGDDWTVEFLVGQKGVLNFKESLTSISCFVKFAKHFSVISSHFNTKRCIVTLFSLPCFLQPAVLSSPVPCFSHLVYVLLSFRWRRLCLFHVFLTITAIKNVNLLSRVTQIRSNH